MYKKVIMWLLITLFCVSNAQAANFCIGRYTGLAEPHVALDIKNNSSKDITIKSHIPDKHQIPETFTLSKLGGEWCLKEKD